MKQKPNKIQVGMLSPVAIEKKFRYTSNIPNYLQFGTDGGVPLRTVAKRAEHSIINVHILLFYIYKQDYSIIRALSTSEPSGQQESGKPFHVPSWIKNVRVPIEQGCCYPHDKQ